MSVEKKKIINSLVASAPAVKDWAKRRFILASEKHKQTLEYTRKCFNVLFLKEAVTLSVKYLLTDKSFLYCSTKPESYVKQDHWKWLRNVRLGVSIKGKRAVLAKKLSGSAVIEATFEFDKKIDFTVIERFILFAKLKNIFFENLIAELKRRTIISETYRLPKRFSYKGEVQTPEFLSQIKNNQSIKLLLENSFIAKDDIYLLSCNLMPVEHNTLRCFASGLNTREAGKKLSMSYRSIEGAAARIKEKFNCSSRGEVLKKFERIQLIEEAIFNGERCGDFFEKEK